MTFLIDDDALCARLLGHDEPVDVRAAYGRFVAQRVETHSMRPRYLAGLGLVAAALVVALLFTPLGTYARGFLTVFEPKQFTPVDVSSIPHDRGIRVDLRAFGTVRDEHLSSREFSSARTIDAVAGYHVLRPSYLPSRALPAARYKVTRRIDDSFTFSARKARAAAARSGKHLPAMPPALDGTTVTMQLGPMVEEHWGDESEATLSIVQTPVPVLRSSGATLAQLESYMLAMPDVTPELAQQIRAIGDPSSTLPVPFRPSKESAQHVVVRGVSGLAVGDNTGVGAFVMWQTHGMLYVVGGPLREDQVLKIADGLR